MASWYSTLFCIDSAWDLKKLLKYKGEILHHLIIQVSAYWDYIPSPPQIFFYKIISFLFLYDWITCGHRNDNCWIAPSLQLLEIMLLLLFPELVFSFFHFPGNDALKRLTPSLGLEPILSMDAKSSPKKFNCRIVSLMENDFCLL